MRVRARVGVRVRLGLRVPVSVWRLRYIYLRTAEQRERLEAEHVPAEIGPALRLARHPLLEHLGRA